MYGVEVSPDLISTVTDGIVAEVMAWQSRPLECMYPVVFDALRVKIRDEASVRSKAIYLALAVLPDGHRAILGLWIEQTGCRLGFPGFFAVRDTLRSLRPDCRLTPFCVPSRFI
jgi:transposase-like protein